MKKIISLMLLGVVTYGSLAQTNRQVAQLTALGKVWGFLKYYHPDAARGNPDWDKELIRMIPLVEGAKTGKAFDSLLEAWYRSLPTARLAAAPVSWEADTVTRVFTEKELQQFNVSKWLKDELVRLYQYHIPDSSRYISRYYKGHQYDHIIHNEDEHAFPACPDREMRLLTLFRYWNTITYFYPHKARITGWEKVLSRYVSKFLQAKDSAQYQYVVRELIHELPDSHSFMQVPGRVGYLYPFRIDYVEGKYLVGECDDSVAKRWDYRLGDEIVAIDGISTREREATLLKTITGTNALSLHRNIAQELLQVGDSVLQVSFKRNGAVINRPVELHTWEVYRRIPKAPAKPLWSELEKGIWYVRFCSISNPDTLRHLFRDIQHAKAVIWEMRAYPNYRVTTELGKFLFPDETQLTEETTASDQYPGMFIKSPYYFTPTDKQGMIYNGPLIVLADEHTQSLSESIAALLKLRPNTVTMGRQTAGTTGNITWFSLPGGIAVSYTGVGVVGMQQGFRQGDGVKIDIPIRLTQARIAKSKDYMLEQAILQARKLK